MNFNELKTRFSRASIPIASFMVAGATYACSWQEVKFVGLAIPITLVTAALLYVSRIYYTDPVVRMNRIEKREKKLFSEAPQAIKLKKTTEKKEPIVKEVKVKKDPPKQEGNIEVEENPTLMPIDVIRNNKGEITAIRSDYGTQSLESFIATVDEKRKFKSQ